MEEYESIRIGSIIGIENCVANSGSVHSNSNKYINAEVIGFVLGASAPCIRIRYLDTDKIELRSDLNTDNIVLINY